MTNDPVVSEVRKIREQLLQDSGGDLRTYVMKVQQLEKELAARKSPLPGASNVQFPKSATKGT
jgi:hypothetical protein